MVPGIVHGRGLGLFYMLGEDGARRGGVAKRAGACEYIGKSVARSLDLDALAPARSHGNIEIARIGRYAFHRPSFPPEFSADDAHPRAVILCDLRNRAGWNVLV